MTQQYFRLKGTVETKGAQGMSDADPTTATGSPVVRRTILFWAIAVGVLIVMHVGGSTLERVE